MTEKPRVVFDTSAWLAYFRGEVPELEQLVETHEILTPDVCLLELADIYSDAPEDELRMRLKFVSFLQEVAETTPEIAIAAAAHPDEPAGKRMALAHASELGIPFYCLVEGALKRISIRDERH